MPAQTRAISWEWNNYLWAEWLVTGPGSWEIYWSDMRTATLSGRDTNTDTRASHRVTVTSETGQQSTENIYTIRQWKLMSMSVSFRLNDPSLRRQLLIFWDIHLKDPSTLSFSSQILEYTDKEKANIAQYSLISRAFRHTWVGSKLFIEYVYSTNKISKTPHLSKILKPFTWNRPIMSNLWCRLLGFNWII